MALAGLVQAAAPLDLAADPLLRFGDLAGSGQHLGQAAGGDHHDPVPVADDQVPRLDPNLAERDRHLVAVRPHAILAGSHEDATAEDRIAELEAARRVAADSVDHGAGKAPSVGDDGQDVAPDGGIEPPPVVQHDDASGRHLVDVVAHAGPGSDCHGDGAHRVRPPYEPEAAVKRRDTEGLTHDAQPVHGIAQRRGAVTPELFNVRVQSISLLTRPSPQKGEGRVCARAYLTWQLPMAGSFSGGMVVSTCSFCPMILTM